MKLTYVQFGIPTNNAVQITPWDLGGHVLLGQEHLTTIESVKSHASGQLTMLYKYMIVACQHGY